MRDEGRDLSSLPSSLIPHPSSLIPSRERDSLMITLADRPQEQALPSAARARCGLGDLLFRMLCQAAAVVVVVLAVLLVVVLVWRSWTAIQATGFHFFTTQDWNPEPTKRRFGALAFVWGTVLTSLLAMLLAVA